MSGFKLVSRRTMLQGTGAAVVLPLLEAMLPRRSFAGTDQPAIPPKMAIFYFGTGMNMREFYPGGVGPDATLSPILKPLEPFRDDFTVFSGTYLKYGGGHTGDYTFLTAAPGFQRGQITNSISADQVAAQKIGKQTRFASLQLSIARGTGYGGTGLSTLAWNERGVPIPAENDPHVVFEQLFGDDDARSAAQQGRRFRRRGSVLDAVLEQARDLERRVGRGDRARLDEYLSSVRTVEQTLQREIAWSQKPKPQPDLDGMGDFSRSHRPGAVADWRYDAWQKLMYDLVTLAFQTDSTRVITFVVRVENGDPRYPEMGVSKGHHALSHHGNDPKNLTELTRFDAKSIEYFSYLLRRLSEAKQVDGSRLLDHSLLAFSSGMGFDHSPDRLPTVMLGGRALGVRHQCHVALAKPTPLASVWHTMLDRLGVQTGDKFQDSTGLLTEVLA